MSRVFYTVPRLYNHKTYSTEQDAIEDCKKETLKDNTSWRIIRHEESEINVTLDRPIEFDNDLGEIYNLLQKIKSNICGSGKVVFTYRSFYNDDFSVGRRISESIAKEINFPNSYPTPPEKEKEFNDEFEWCLVNILDNYPPEKIEINKVNTGNSKISGIRLNFLEKPSDLIPELKQKGYDWELDIFLSGNGSKAYIHFSPYARIEKSFGVDLTNRSIINYIDKTLDKLNNKIKLI